MPSSASVPGFGTATGRKARISPPPKFVAWILRYMRPCVIPLRRSAHACLVFPPCSATNAGVQEVVRTAVQQWMCARGGPTCQAREGHLQPNAVERIAAIVMSASGVPGVLFDGDSLVR